MFQSPGDPSNTCELPRYQEILERGTISKHERQGKWGTGAASTSAILFLLYFLYFYYFIILFLLYTRSLGTKKYFFVPFSEGREASNSLFKNVFI